MGKSQQTLKANISAKTRKKLRSLSVLNNYSGPLGILTDWMWVVASIAATKFLGYIAYFPAIIIIGSRVRGLGDMLHHSSHGTLAKNQKLNYFLGTFCSGWAIGQLFTPYQDSHVRRHHTFLGDPSKDPDETTKEPLYTSKNRWDFIFLHLAPTMLGLKSYENLKNLFRDRFKIDKSDVSQVRELRLFVLYWSCIILVAIWFGVLVDLILFWLIPFVLPFQSINYLIELCEHHGRTRTGRSKLYTTRNRLGPFWESFLFSVHGEGYHLVHHLAPTVPFWNMRRAHNALLDDDCYRVAAMETGGIFSAHHSKRSILSEIIDYHDRCGSCEFKFRCASNDLDVVNSE